MTAPKRLLIVNADDFGRSQGINRGVAIAHEEGIVTSASLMVNRPGAEEASAYAKLHPMLSVGLHVELGEWVYRDGDWEAVNEVAGPTEQATRQQLTTFRKLVGGEPTHLDSHQHVHRQGEAATVLTAMASELRIPLRGCDPRIHFCGDFYGQTAKGEQLLGAISVEALVDLLGRLSHGVTELGCHPGVGTDEDLPYGRERSMEVKSLCDPRTRSAIIRYGLELRSFSEL